MDGLPNNNNSHRHNSTPLPSSNLADIVASSPVGMVVSRTDGSFMYANPALIEMLGYTEEEIYLPHVIVSHPDEKERNQEIRQQLIDNPNKTITLKKRFLHKKGQTLIGLTSYTSVIEHGVDNYYFIAQIVNISEQIHTEKSINLFRSMINSSREAMFILAPENGQIVDANVHGCKTLGYSYEELLELSISDIDSHLKDKEHWDRILATARNTKRVLFDGLHCRKNASTFHAEMSLNHIISDGMEYILAISRDVTERKKSEELIWEQAHYDVLTQLPNRNMLYTQLKDTIKKAEDKHTRFATLCLDLDGFKEINDTLGHYIGDKLLIETGKRIRAQIRPQDIVARLGGDEFCIILHCDDAEQDITLVTHNILHSLKDVFRFDTHDIFTSASVGICFFPDDAEDADGLLKYSDQAMYAAKKQGRDCLEHFTSQMQKRALDRMELSRDLHSALKKQQFHVEYQPIFSMDQNTIIKAEALLRWNHPIKGPVGPQEFIPIAEANGTINEIGLWVFKEAIKTVSHWRNTIHPDFKISVNASPLYFRAGNNVLAQWQQALTDANLPGNAIVIEITEGILLESSDHVINTLKNIKNSGMEIALDDFGTGYSSLAYLSKLNIDYLKIDKSFIDNLQKSDNDEALCEAIILMAHKLKLNVIAEGIETTKQHQLMQQFECDYGQGYLISKSLNASDFEQLIQQSPPNQPQ